MLNETATRGGNTKRGADSRRKLLDAARKLFVARGYHDTRPQDIARAAGLGHGTFYLHFPDKRACFLAFVEEARAELDAEVFGRAEKTDSFAQMVEVMLNAIYDYGEKHPGVLLTAMSDESVISTEGPRERSLVEKWAAGWGDLIQRHVASGQVAPGYDPFVIGAAIVGLIHQGSTVGFHAGVPRARLIANLTRFIVRALAPDADASPKPKTSRG